MLPSVAPEVDSGDALVDNASVAQASEEYGRSLWRALGCCQALYNHVDSTFREEYFSYVARDIIDEKVAYKLRVLWSKCRVCNTNAGREFHKAAEQLPYGGNSYKADCAAVELRKQCDELMQLMTELDAD